MKFTGKRFDAESGLYYYNTRYYDALTGRFISKDKLYYELLMNNELNRLFLNIQSVMPLAEEQLPMQQIIDLKNYIETPQRLQPIVGQDDGIVYYMYQMFAQLAGVLKSIGFDIKYFDLDSIDKLKNPQQLNYYVYALNNPANLIDVMGGCTKTKDPIGQEKFNKLSKKIEKWWKETKEDKEKLEKDKKANEENLPEIKEKQPPPVDTSTPNIVL